MNKANWFTKLVGFEERNREQVHRNIKCDEETMVSLRNGKSFKFGSLEIVDLQSLRLTHQNLNDANENTINEVIGDVKFIHTNPKNYRSCFQAASQFNLLEMVHPGVTPEQGISGYEDDLTQGPACAIACGAGTIYRNYFVKVNDQIGQTSDAQINCLDLIGEYFQNDRYKIWTMKNGYLQISEPGLERINNILGNSPKDEYELIKGLLKVGVQIDTQVTIVKEYQEVTQIYCSALPVAYSSIDKNKWEPFSRLILEATYEATILLAAKNYARTGNNRLFLTLVGGGAFGNSSEWIIDSIESILKKYRYLGLDIRFVSYGGSSLDVQKIIGEVGN